jgi:hypothetical protein
MPIVKTVQDKGDKAALLVLDDGSKPIWTPDRELARTLVGKPIPPDWVRKDGEYGPQAFPPKQGKGGRFRDTKEAFEAEAASRLRWQELEEERKDRRTAWMTAAEQRNEVVDIIQLADVGYEWLRTSPAGGSLAPPAGGTTSAPVQQARPEERQPRPRGSGAEEGTGGGSVDREATAVVAGPNTAQASPGFPMSPEECNHKTASGRWVQWRDGVCPKCGLSQLLAMEG